MKKILLTAIAAMACMVAGAQSRMILNGTDNSTNKFDITNVSKITFTDNGNLNVYDQLGASQSFSLQTLRTITFEGDFTAIASPEATTKGKIAFAYNAGEVSISGLEKPATAVVCSTSGAVVARQRVAEGESLNVTALAKGVYVVVVDGASFKFVK